MKFSTRIQHLQGLIESSERILSDTIPKGHIDLTSSVPPFPVPGILLNTAQEIIRSENLNYTETYGLPKLRKGLAEKYNLKWGADGVTITTGTTEALFCVLAALLNPGDELLVPALTLPSHKSVSLFFLGTVREYPVSMDSAYQINASTLIDLIRPETKAILINNPLIATGQLFHPKEFEILSTYCEKQDIFILVDESYYEIHYAGYESASFIGYGDHVICFSSMTKLFCMSGLRIGWLFTIPEITEAVNSVRYISSTCANTFSQRFALRMVKGLGQETKEKLLSILQNRRKLMFETLKQHGFTRYIESNAGYFILLNIRSELNKPCSDTRFTKLLKDRHEIIVTPGSYFGAAAEGYIRISFATDESNIQQGIAGIRECIKEFNL
ncbi:MAG: pyridoxal phosphate-dependent aminotransferase [Candidatus Marinimicrobia bacterium]|nr:pyridoxal phosphate-dependent aminotransferase [Candidatus Neomarinimicrobiota bacterium]